MKTLVIGAFVDWMGSAGKTADEEIEDIESKMRELFCDEFKIIFKRAAPDRRERFDVYILDFGGVLPGCEDTVRNCYRELLHMVADYPSTLFILWSTFSMDSYTDLMEQEMPELKGAPNVTFITNHLSKVIRAWFKKKEGER